MCFLCVCAPDEYRRGEPYLYGAKKRERREERTMREERASACKSRVRSADVGAHRRRALRQDKAGGVARRLTIANKNCITVKNICQTV